MFIHTFNRAIAAISEFKATFVAIYGKVVGRPYRYPAGSTTYRKGH